MHVTDGSVSMHVGDLLDSDPKSIICKIGK